MSNASKDNVTSKTFNAIETSCEVTEEFSDSSLSSCLMSKLNEQRLSGSSLCDVTLLVNDVHPYLLHKAVLAGSSQLFSQTLTENPGCMQLKFCTASVKGFSDILDYVYTGRLRVSLETAGEMINISRRLLLIGDVERFVELFLVRHANKSNAQLMSELVDLYSLEELGKHIAIVKSLTSSVIVSESETERTVSENGSKSKSRSKSKSYSESKLRNKCRKTSNSKISLEVQKVKKAKNLMAQENTMLEDVVSNLMTSKHAVPTEIEDLNVVDLKDIPLLPYADHADENSSNETKEARKNSTRQIQFAFVKKEEPTEESSVHLTRRSCRELKNKVVLVTEVEPITTRLSSRVLARANQLTNQQSVQETNHKRRGSKRVKKENDESDPADRIDTDAGEDDKSGLPPILREKRRKRTMRAKSEAEFYRCDRCPKSFPTPSRLRTHERGHGLGTPYLCPLCGFTTKYYASMYIHKRIHQGLSPLPSRPDGAKTEAPDGTGIPPATVERRRRRTKRATFEEDFYRCKLCSRSYPTPSKLRSHERAHGLGHKYLCIICGFSTKYFASFHVHNRQHNGKKFKCTYSPNCRFEAILPKRIEDHINVVHHGIKTHVCAICGKSYGRQKYLQRHQFVHSAECGNVLRCSICEFKTNRPDYLRRHVAKNHGVAKTTDVASYAAQSSVVYDAMGTNVDTVYELVLTEPTIHVHGKLVGDR